MYSKKVRSLLKDTSSIYIFINKKSGMAYVVSAANTKQRLVQGRVKGSAVGLEGAPKMLAKKTKKKIKKTMRFWLLPPAYLRMQGLRSKGGCVAKKLRSTFGGGVGRKKTSLFFRGFFSFSLYRSYFNVGI